jgi:hypothetical protein
MKAFLKLFLICALLVLAVAWPVSSQVTTTINIGFQLPAYGSQSWQVPFYYNFNLLDQILGGQVPFAVPAYTVATLPTGIIANTFVVVTDANPDCSQGGGNTVILCQFANSSWRPITAPTSIASGTVSVTALSTAGCTSSTISVSGATTGMVVAVSPSSAPNANTVWTGYVGSSNSVTVQVCTLSALTPSAVIYNWRLIR